jgi:RHS repeat-associated protein
MAFAENTVAEQGKQPYKYNNKELDQMHGLNWYDNDARPYDPVIPRTPTPDPHAENYYSWSPYSWVGNNPMKYIDPTGMDTTYVNPQGETILTIPGGANVQMPAANDVVVTSNNSNSYWGYASTAFSALGEWDAYTHNSKFSKVFESKYESQIILYFQYY